MCKYTYCIFILYLFYYIVRPPIIDSIMLNQGLDILQTAVFICNAAGYDVSYYWMVESGSLPNKAVGINSSTLVVSDLRSSDSNLYICEASNLVGKVNSSKQLMVTGMYLYNTSLQYNSLHLYCRFANCYRNTILSKHRSN